MQRGSRLFEPHRGQSRSCLSALTRPETTPCQRADLPSRSAQRTSVSLSDFTKISDSKTTDVSAFVWSADRPVVIVGSGRNDRGVLRATGGARWNIWPGGAGGCLPGGVKGVPRLLDPDRRRVDF